MYVVLVAEGVAQVLVEEGAQVLENIAVARG